MLTRKEVGRWGKLLALEEEEEVLGTDVERMTAEEKEDEEEEEVWDLREQLRNLGRLKDVKDVVEEIDCREGFVSCPSLERVNYCSPREYYDRPEL